MRQISNLLDRLIVDQAALLSELDRFIDLVEGKSSSRNLAVKASNETLEQLQARKRKLQSQLIEAAGNAREFDNAHNNLVRTMRNSKPGTVDMERVGRALEDLKRQRERAEERVIDLGKKIRELDEKIRRKQRQRQKPSPRRMSA